MSTRTGPCKFGFSKEKKKERYVVKVNIFTPLNDYKDIEVSLEEWSALTVDWKKFESENNLPILSFVYQGKKVMLMPGTVRNSILEYNFYKKYWWGLRKLK